MRLALAAVLLALTAATAHAGGYVPGGETPGACRGPAFTDVVLTAAGDQRAASIAAVPQRLYGLSGSDWLSGSAALPSCLFGGQGDDLLMLGAAGGVALGEVGRDVLIGSPGPDALSGGDGGDTMAGLGGIDVLRGGRAIDAYSGGEGADVLDSHDGRRELVDCGPGQDTVQADGFDALIGCERGQIAGARLPQRTAKDARVRFVAPLDGEYRLLAECGEMGRATGLIRGQRAVLRVPAACARSGFLVHAPSATGPVEPHLLVTKLAP